MSESKHTPGPFCVESATSAYLLDVCLDYEVPGAGCPVLVAHCFHDEDDDCVSPKPISVREAKANARLFAAAPDLLAACKAAAGWLGEPDADSLEEWERIAEMFYRDTGFLRPGKSYPMEGPTPNEAKQREAWSEWCASRSRTVREQLSAAISKATQ